MRPLSRIARGVASASHLLLIALMLAALRSGEGTALQLLLVLPLLLPLAGILRGRGYTYGWASMLLVFYASGYLAAGYARPEHKWASFGLATIAAIDFVALVLYVRLRQREGVAATR